MVIQGAEPFSFDRVINSNSVLASCMMYSTYDLNGKDAAILLTAFDLFMRYEMHHPVPYKNERCTCLIVSDTDDIHLTPEPRVLGQTASFIMIFNNRSSHLPIRNSIRVAIVLEELLHCYYCIRNEWDVKVLVALLLRESFPEETLHRLYPRMFDEDGNPIYTRD